MGGGVDAVGGVGLAEVVVAGGDGGGGVVEGGAVGAVEGEGAVGLGVDAVAAFVDEAVVGAAQLGEVGEGGFAASGAVGDVVGVCVAVVGAAGEPASPVSGFEGPGQGGGNGGGAPADIDGGAVGTLEQVDDPGVTGQPAGGVGGQGGPVFEMATASGVVLGR